MFWGKWLKDILDNPITYKSVHPQIIYLQTRSRFIRSCGYFLILVRHMASGATVTYRILVFGRLTSGTLRHMNGYSGHTYRLGSYMSTNSITLTLLIVSCPQ